MAALDGIDATYAFLSNDSIVIPGSINGVVKMFADNTGSFFETNYRLFNGSTEVTLIAASIVVTMPDTSYTVTTVQNGKGVDIRFSQGVSCTPSEITFADIDYTFESVTYTKRINLTVVKDGLNNNQLLFADANIGSFVSDETSFTTPNVKTAITYDTKGLFTIPGDVIRIRVYYSVDVSSTFSGDNFFRLDINSSGNTIFERVIDDVSNSLFEMELIAVSPLGSCAYKYGNEDTVECIMRIDSKSSYATQNEYSQTATFAGMFYQDLNSLITISNVGSLILRYSFQRDTGEPSNNLTIYNFMIEKKSNADLGYTTVYNGQPITFLG